MLKKRLKVDYSRFYSFVFKDKKSQVTLFIILGLLLLLALVLVVLLKQEVIVFKPEELIPTQKGKVESYITSCISEIGKESLFLLGLHGGYINVSSDIVADGTQHVKLSPTEVVPYWASGKTIRIPTLNEMKLQLDRRMEDNLRNCLLNKTVFNNTYTIVEKSNISADTKITDQKVIFNVKWDLEIKDKSGEVITQVVNHVSESPVKLKKVYDTSTKILYGEMNQLKIEELTLDLISLEHPSVPLMGIELSCTKRSWKVNEVKDKLKDMLRININELKIKETDYVNFPSTQPYYQNHYVWDLGLNSSKDIQVNFNYNNNFPFYFEVTPREGNVLKSGSTGGSDLLSYICIQMWKFTYDVSYPVLVQVVDSKNSYVFNTAFTVHLKNNRADRSDASLTPSAVIIDYPTSDTFCQKRDIPITVNTYELIENNVTGVYWKDPLDEVNLTYTCLKYQCPIGQTEYTSSGAVASYKTNFPYCTGGILRGKKEGYAENWVRVVSNQAQSVDLVLVPLFNLSAKKITVLKHDFNSISTLGQGSISSTGKPLDKNETVLIQITRNKEEYGLHKESLVLSPSLDKTLSEKSYLKFLAGTDYEYELEIYLLDKDGIKGGYSANWTAEWDYLKTSNELVFHILSKDSFKDQDEMYAFQSELNKYSKINAGILKPEYK